MREKRKSEHCHYVPVPLTWSSLLQIGNHQNPEGDKTSSETFPTNIESTRFEVEFLILGKASNFRQSKVKFDVEIPGRASEG